MADLLQSSSTTATAAPAYYTDYLSNLASKGTAAGAAATAPASAAAWDPNALQTQAFGNAASNVGNYQPGLATAGGTLGNAAATNVTGAANPYLTAGTTTSGLSAAQPNLTAGSSSSADLVGNYMNPYTQNVVNQIGAANQQNIAQNLSPAITSGAVGGGQFGSQRGANALSMGISNANLGALTQQTAALQSGYTQALQAAQAQRAAQLAAGQSAGTLQNAANANQVAAGQVAGNTASQQGQLESTVGGQQASLANQTQQQGLADVNALSTLGGQQQTIAQQKALQPLDVLGKQASIMSGAQLPMSTTSTMHASPLSAIAGLGATAAGLAGIKTGTGANAGTVGGSIGNWLSNQFASTPAPAGATGTGSNAGNNSTDYGGTPAAGVTSDNAGGYIANGVASDINGDPLNADGTVSNPVYDYGTPP